MKELIQYLLDAGADINIANRHGNPPLDVARESNNDEIAEYLIEKGADITSENGNDEISKEDEESSI